MKYLLASHGSEEQANAAKTALEKEFPGKGKIVIDTEGTRHKVSVQADHFGTEELSQGTLDQMRQLAGEKRRSTEDTKERIVNQKVGGAPTGGPGGGASLVNA